MNNNGHVYITELLNLRLFDHSRRETRKAVKSEDQDIYYNMVIEKLHP